MTTKLLEQIAAPENLLGAWRAVRGNIPKYRRRRASGPDGVSLADFEQDLKAQLSVLRDMMLKGRYQAEPPAYFAVPKKGGGQRMLAILPVRDRVAQRATQQVLEPLWEPDFLPCSFGFRPGLSIEQAVGYVHDLRTSGLRWVVDGDIAACFDNLDHDLLVARVKRKVKDSRVISLLQNWLDAGVMQAGPPENVNMEFARRIESVKGFARRGVSWALDAVAREADPFGRHDYGFEPDDPALYPDAGSVHVNGVTSVSERDLVVSGMRRAALRQMLASGVMLGMGFVRARASGLLSRAGTAVKIGLASPAGRRLLRKGAMATGGLAGVAAAAAVTAWLMHRKVGPGPAGVLQGSPLSPLLANVYLHPFDVALTRKDRYLARFADDWVILCGTQDEAESAYNDALRALAALKLKANLEKTRILSPEEKLDWLGTVIA